MRYRIEVMSFFFIVSNLILLLPLYLFGNKLINIFSVIALSIVTGLVFLIYKPQIDNAEKKSNLSIKSAFFKTLYFSDVNISNRKANIYIISILFSNVIFATLNSYFVMSKIEVKEITNGINLIHIVKAMNIASIIITQFGGFCIQGILIYMVAVVSGTEKKLSGYLRIVGFSYVGFLLLTICSIFINIYLIPDCIPLSQFKATFENSFLHGWIGKSGEYLVLIFISLGIYNSDSFSFPKSIAITTIPTILLMIMKLIFDNLI